MPPDQIFAVAAIVFLVLCMLAATQYCKIVGRMR